MGLESATYISQLVATNPLGSDEKQQGDNHMRLLKSVLKAQFPNLGVAAVTATAAQLNALFDDKAWVPSGAIMMWSGSVATIPLGWVVCDGTNSTPNLASKFVMGTITDTGSTYDVGDTGGSFNLAAHTTEETILTVAQMPSHTHIHKLNTWVGSDDATSSVNGAILTAGRNYRTGTSAPTGSYLESKGDSEGHTHSIAEVVGAILPPFYALAYIMKV